MSDFVLLYAGIDAWRDKHGRLHGAAIAVPKKGKQPPKAPEGRTVIDRTANVDFGSSEMIGCHIRGGYENSLNAENIYDCSYSRIGKNSTTTTGLAYMIKVDFNYAIRVSHHNPSWYPGLGMIEIVDARNSGYAYENGDTYPYYYRKYSASGVYSRWWSKIPIPLTIQDMSIDEIIDYCESFSAGRNNDQPSDDSEYEIVVGNRHYGQGYYLDRHGLVNPRTLDPSGSERFGECIKHNRLRFHQALLDDSIYFAYYNALDSLPKDEINWFATILDLVELVIAVITGNIKLATDNIPKLLSKAWLSYRYAYSTTKMDVEEIGDTRHRLRKIEEMYNKRKDTLITAFGTSEKDGTVTRVSLTYSASDILELDNFLETTKRMLLYDAWDMIPFSFIVDWFVAVGDMFHEKSLKSYAMKLKPVTAWCSVSYTSKSRNGATVERYFRYRLAGIPGRPIGYKYIVGPNASTLSVKHSLDSLAIVIGML